MTTAAKISADLLANDAQFVDGFNRAATAVGRFAQSAQKDINNVSRQFDRLISNVSGIKGALGTVATIGGFSMLTKGAVDSAAAIQKLAEQLDLTTNQVQKYQFAATQTSVSQESLLTAFNNINKLIAEGKLPYQNLNQAISDIANRMQNAATGSDRAKIAFDTMGKAGKELIPFFLGGADALRQYGDEAERIGAVLPQDTIQRAVEFKEQIEALATVVTKNFQAGMLKEFTDDSGKIKDIYSDPSFVRGVQELGSAFGVMADALIKMVEYADKIMTVIGAMSAMATSGNDKEINQGILDEMNSRLGLDGTGLTGGMNINNTPKVKSKNKAPGVSPLIQGPGPSSQLDAYIKSLNAETDAIGLSERALFQQKAATEAAGKAMVDYKNGLRPTKDLTDQESASIEEMAGKFYDLKKAQAEAEKFNQEFKSGFEDAAASVINGSKSMGDALRQLIVQFAALIEKELILAPLANSIFGQSGSGGLGGMLAGFGGMAGAAGAFGSQGSLARLFETGSASFVGPLPAYDKGTSYVPNDQIAQIHKGEAVLTPEENAAYQRGQVGSSLTINAPGASKADVIQLKALVMALAGPGRVEDRIKIARQRGQGV